MADNNENGSSGDMPAGNVSQSEGAVGGTESGDANKPSLLEQTTSNKSTSDWLHQYFAKAMGITGKPDPESVLDEVSFEGIARYINSDKCQKIVTMAGAGISTSAGIPDFRSPGTGLYDNLEKYNLPTPQSVFDISYFEENPEPFFILCRDLFPGEYEPTPCHYFLKLLENKGKLLRHFTQNIDTLERMAGMSDEKVIEAHGTFHLGHCRQCNHEYTQDWLKDKILNAADKESPVPKCEQEDCEGVVKPDIVFFGESLPPKFAQSIGDLEECDMLIIMGTSLVVQPFASLTSRVKDTTPRLYINLEQTGGGSSHPITVLMFGGGFAFDQEGNIRDVFWQGTCDDGCKALADLLGWEKDFEKLIKDGHQKYEKEKAKKSKPAVANKKASPASNQKATPAANQKASPAANQKASPTANQKVSPTPSKKADNAKATPTSVKKSPSTGSAPAKSGNGSPSNRTLQKKSPENSSKNSKDDKTKKSGL